MSTKTNNLETHLISGNNPAQFEADLQELFIKYINPDDCKLRDIKFQTTIGNDGKIHYSALVVAEYIQNLK